MNEGMPVPVASVKFQSCEEYEAVRGQGVGCVLLGQNIEVGAFVGMPPGFPLAGNGIVKEPVAVGVRCPNVESVLDAVACVSTDDIDELAVVLLANDAVDEDGAVQLMLASGCVLRLAGGMGFGIAEIIEEFDHPLGEAEV